MKDAREDLSPAIEVINIVPVDPVKDVEKPVETQSRYVVRGDVFNDSNFVKHHNLRDECNCFEPKTVAPHELPRAPTAVDYQCHN